MRWTEIIEGLAGRIARGFLPMSAALLVACGGGGGSGSGATSEGQVSMAFTPSTLNASTIVSYPTVVNFSGRITGLGAQPAYIFLEDEQNLVNDGGVSGDNGEIQGYVGFSGSQIPGTYATTLVFHLCPDEACTSEFPGSPFRLPITYQVKPNITAAAPEAMRRKGQEPAPAQSVKLSVPADAGTLRVELQASDEAAFKLSLDGDTVKVATTQMRAGTYEATVTVRGSADERYATSFDLSYVVEPPEGGEREPYFEPSWFQLNQPQGTKTLQRFKLVRPTWTSEMTPVSLTDTAVLKDLRSLGNDEYEVTVDTTNRPVNESLAGAVVSTTLDGAYRAVASFSVSVDAIAYLANSEFGSISVNAQSPASELVKSSAVLTVDNRPARWTATSDATWLKVRKASGMANVDDLVVEADPSVLQIAERLQIAQVTISLDRPGSLPIVQVVGLTNDLPRFDQVSPNVMLASSGRVWVHGNIFERTGLLKPGVLSASGATLRGAQVVLDDRFVGGVGLLAVDLQDVQPGVPVTLRATGLLGSTQLTVESLAPPEVPAGRVALPFGAYRPPTYMPKSSMLVWSGGGKVWRWTHNSGAWATARSTPVPGVIDVAPSLDDAKLFATVKDSVTTLRSDTLGGLGTSALPPYESVSGAKRLDSAVPALARGLTMAADGRAFASMRWLFSTEEQFGVQWLTGANEQDFSYTYTELPDLSLNPRFGDPGYDYLTGASTAGVGSGLSRSAHGLRLAFSHNDAGVQLYRGIGQSNTSVGKLASGEVVTAVSDAGNWLFSSDGLLHVVPWRASGDMIDMAARVPSGFVAGGYGLTGNGKLALVYGYRIVETSSDATATDPTLWVYDTTRGLSGLALPDALLATVPLTAPVGCTAPLGAGETCRHRAMITVAPGDRSVFILGPRGLEALTLPQSVTALAARKNSLAAPRKGALSSVPVRLDSRPAKR